MGNEAGTPQLTFTFDTVAPEPSLTTSVANADTLGYTNVDPIEFTITFTDSMPFFDISHLTLTGDITSSTLVPGADDTVWTVEITPNSEGDFSTLPLTLPNPSLSPNPWKPQP